MSMTAKSFESAMTVPGTTLPSSMGPACASLWAKSVAKSSVSISGVRGVWFSIR